MSERGPLVLLTAIALMVTVVIVLESRSTSDDEWSERAGRTILQADVVRDPLAKGEEVCLMVTRKGAITTVPCKPYAHRIINPAPPPLPERIE